MKKMHRRLIMLILLAVAIFFLPADSFVGTRAGATGDGEYVIEEILLDWTSKTFYYAEGTVTVEDVLAPLPTQLDLIINSERFQGVKFSWYWEVENGSNYDPFVIEDSLAPLPNGKYLLNAFQGENDTVSHPDLGEGDIPVTLGSSPPLSVPNVSIIVMNPSVENEDYAYNADTGALTIKSDSGIAAWKAHPLPTEIKTVTLAAAVTTIPADAFKDCNQLSTVTFEGASQLTTIGNSAFNGCSKLTAIVIPTGVTSIGESAFNGCSALTAINIPTGVTSIEAFTFSSCSALETVAFEADSALEYLGMNAFRSCEKLKALHLPEGFQSFGLGCFSGCTSLESINIPAGVEDEGAGENASWLFGNNKTFQDCKSLKVIEVSENSAFFTSIDGMVYSKDGAVLLYCPRALGTTKYTIPSGTTVIGGGAFQFNNSLERVIIHEDVTRIESQAFQHCEFLVHIDIQGKSKLEYLGESAFERESSQHVGEDYAYLDLFLPRSLTNKDMLDSLLNLFVDMDHPEETATIRLSVYYNSTVAKWCAEQGYPFYYRPDSLELQANPPKLMYKYVPYLFTPQTTIPTNEDLVFWLEDTSGNPLSLPAGLTLYDGAAALPPGAPDGIRPGAIYGAPLDYTDFVNGVEFVMKACNKSDINKLYPASATFIIKLAATPDNAQLEQEVNYYPFITDAATGDDGRIEDVITGDRDSYATHQTLHIEGPFGLFESFWINGVQQEQWEQYRADDGSITVTVFAKTIKNLDNGTYTAAAAFRTESGKANDKNSELNIVAQNFTVNLIQGSNPREEDTGSNEDGAPIEDTLPPEITPTQESEETPADAAEEVAEGEEPAEELAEPHGEDAQETEETTEDAQSDESADAPQERAGGASAPAGTGGTGATETTEAEESEEPNTTETTQSTQVQSSTDSTGQPAPDNTGRTGALLGGLEVGSDGAYFYEYDGVSPLELRLDMPFEEFEGLRVNGQLWVADIDYTAHAGSTIIHIPAEKLAYLEEGMNTIIAHFAGDVTAAFTFRLIRPAPQAAGESGLPPLAVGVIIVAALLAGGAVVVVVIKRRAATVR